MIRCINGKCAHWGIIFDEGKEYNFEYMEGKDVSIITDYEKYYHYISISASSIDWIRQGYKQENLHEVIPDFLQHSEIMERYTMKVKLPFIKVKGDDGNSYPLCILTKEEILSLYDIAINKHGKIAFTYSTYLVDEYFEFKEITRDKKLKELGI
jgi:hypothetical protein